MLGSTRERLQVRCVVAVVLGALVGATGGCGGKGKVKSDLCYTPCQRSLSQADGTYVSCPADGLMPGCYGGAVCDDGACVLPKGTERPEALLSDAGAQLPTADPLTLRAGTGHLRLKGDPTCVAEVDCPDFQRCLDGRCKSECVADEDCGGGTRCYRHVCRRPCTVDEARCSGGAFCRAVDSQNGFCMPAPRRDEGAALVSGEGSFSVGPATTVTPQSLRRDRHRTALSFGPQDTTSKFTITNHGAKAATFTVRKVKQVDLTAAGRTTYDETQSPLPWIRMGEAAGSTAQVQELTLDLQARKSAEVVLENLVNPELNRWEGELRVESSSGNQLVALRYSATPRGQWAGNMYYFSNFGDTGLWDWVKDRSDNTKLQNVGNALVKRWGALKQGEITLDEFLAVLSATRSESWKSAAVKARCPDPANPNPNVACYLWDDPARDDDPGLSVYTQNVQQAPVPTGAVELPFAMNIDLPDAANPKQWQGKILSQQALHFAGEPTVTVNFEDDPTSCNPANLDACLVYLEDVSPVLSGLYARVLVGGRFYSTAADGSCAGATGYTSMPVPWLVPGFTTDPLTGVTLATDDGTGTSVRYECRDSLLPFTADSGNAGFNPSLAGSNPIPDGRPRERELNMVDGALINSDALFVLFMETFPAFLGPADGEGVTSYGYMLLVKGSATLEDDPAAFQGNDPVDARPQPDLLGATCSSALLQKVGGTLNASSAASLATIVLDGVTATSGVPTLPLPSDPDYETVHAYCADTGLIDGGPNAAAKLPCPSGSEVVYFTTKGASQRDLSGLDCQANGLQFTYELKYETVDGQTAPVPVPLVFVDPASESKRGTCGARVQAWRQDAATSATSDYRFDLVWCCGDATADPQCTRDVVSCDVDRTDLRLGKVFFAAGSSHTHFLPLATATDMAFRYKTKFRNRDGKNLGFTPIQCEPGNAQVTYCYAPDEIEQVRERVDCLLEIYTRHYEDLASQPLLRASLKSFLVRDFAYTQEPQTLVTHDGFERLFAELGIMLGDESFTQAFGARFDLAGINLASFPGAAFEPNGIDLSGGAGFEMYRLYQAAQYYQLVLDRFYRIAPEIWRALAVLPDSGRFITQETVVSYFDRLVRASGQKSRAWSEIALRYQSFNRPDLARLVIQRAYTSAYLESAVLARMMLRVVDVSSDKYKAQITAALEDGQLRARQGLLKMREVYAKITDDVTFFGLAPDYIPFPALEPLDTNAFAKLLATAKGQAAVAREKESLALASTREFDTNAAAFEEELTSLRTTYEKQLMDICGSFVGDDGNVYPAVPKYAEMSAGTTMVQQAAGTPCGLVGNGELYNAVIALSQTRVDMDELRRTQEEIKARLAIEQERVNAQCLTMDAALKARCKAYDKLQEGQCQALTDKAAGDCSLFTKRYEWVLAYESLNWEMGQEIQRCEMGIEDARRMVDVAGMSFSLFETAMGLADTKMIAGMVMSTIYSAAAGVTEAVTWGLQGKIQQLEGQIADNETSIEYVNMRADCELAELEAETGCTQAYLEATAECDLAAIDNDLSCELARIDSTATMKTIMLDFAKLETQALRIQLNVQLALSNIQKLRNDSQAILDQQTDAEQLLINRAAAQSDPNVRIFKNDAVVTADRTFDRAMVAAYRATKVFEYYTSQSYAKAGDLFLVRTVAFGDYNLDTYLGELEDAFYEFGERYGNPDKRVAIISLANDVLKIPQQQGGVPLTEQERATLFRAQVSDPAKLDPNGYIAIPFSTSLESLSPLTRNHKILYVEAELLGKDLGDAVARVYLTQKGTGVVSSLGGEKLGYSFPERTAVIDTFFAGNKDFAADVYRSDRLRDRPFVATQWVLTLNQRDEEANRDIDLRGLSDVRLYIYYTDFTAL